LKPLNLLYVTSSIDSIHDYRILSYHSKNPNIKVFLATCDPRNYYPGILDLNITILEKQDRQLHSNNPIIGRLINEYKHRRFVSFLKKMIKKQHIELIHSGWLTIDSYDALKTGFHPVLAMSWGSDVLNNPYMENPYNSKRLLKRLEYVAKRADAIYSDADVVAETIMGLTGINHNKIHVFPQLGVDLNLFKPNEDMRRKCRDEYDLKENKVVVMSRNFYPVYAVEDFIKALPKVIDLEPKTKVLLAGDGPLRNNVVRLIEELKLKSIITILGSVPNEKLPLIYNGADIYVSTSLSDGTSLSLLEAMSCGLPAVVTDVPANLEWVKDGYNGYIAERGNKDSIADKVIVLLQSPEKMREFGERNSRIAAEKADIKKNYEKLGSLYRFVVNK
jgi:glycosyltransferase involved in cell wall biosynthesis